MKTNQENPQMCLYYVYSDVLDSHQHIVLAESPEQARMFSTSDLALKVCYLGIADLSLGYIARTLFAEVGEIA